MTETVELDQRCRFVDATSRQTWQWVVANSDELAGPPAPPGFKGDAQFALVTAGERYLVAFPRSGVDAGKHTTGDEVMQPRALQLSDQWAAAVQRATRPLAKSSDACSVSISIDRVALPMEEPIEAPPVPIGPPWVVAALATAPPHSPEVQAIIDEQNQGDEPKVARNFRMAYVATVTLHDGEGESLHTIRYGRMPKGDVRQVGADRGWPGRSPGRERHRRILDTSIRICHRGRRHGDATWQDPSMPDVVGCLGCDIAAGRCAVPGGILYETTRWIVNHAVGRLNLGTLIVAPREHVVAVANLDDIAASELGPLLRDAAGVVEAICRPEQTYVCVWSHGPTERRHLHILVQPVTTAMVARYGGLRAEKLQATLMTTGEPPATADVEQFCDEARQRFAARIGPPPAR